MPAKPSSVVSWQALLVGWIWPFVGIASWTLIWLKPDTPLLPVVFYPVGLFACCVISIVIHELAHFWTAKWLGLTPYEIVIGNGPKAVEHRFREFRLILNTYPYCGLVRIALRRSRWKYLLVLLAGPLSNLLLLAMAFGFLLAGVWAYTHSSGVQLPSPIAQQMILVNALLVVSTLVPYRLTIGDIKTCSDGMQILSIIFGKSPTLIDIHLEKLATTGSTRDNQSTGYWNNIIHIIPVEKMLLQYSSQLLLPSLKGPERNHVLDEYITAVLMYRASKFLPQAEEYSRQLVSNEPNNLSFLGSRGSVLVEMGDLESGAAMLEKVYSQSNNDSDRAISAAFLALADLKRGRVDSARQWIGRSFELDKNCLCAVRVSRSLPKSDDPRTA
jgi:hypothetical protein